MRKDKKQAGRDLTNEKNRHLAPPGGNLFRFGLYFVKKRKNGQAGMRRTEKRGNFRCPMEKCSAGGAEKAPPAPVVPSRRRAVVPFYRCVVAPVGKGIRVRMFQKRRGRGERKEK